MHKREKKDKWDLIKIKDIQSTKDSVKKVKRNCRLKKYLQTIYLMEKKSKFKNILKKVYFGKTGQITRKDISLKKNMNGK